MKTFYKNPPIFYSHYICVCVYILTYSLAVSKSFFDIYSFSLVIYVNASQIYSESPGISSWINFELKLLFSVYLLHNFASSNDGIHALAFPWVPAERRVWYLNTVKWGVLEAYCLATLRLDNYFVESVYCCDSKCHLIMIKLFRWKSASYNMNVKHLYSSATAFSVKTIFIFYRIMLPSLWCLYLTMCRHILLWLTLAWRFASCLRFSQ